MPPTGGPSGVPTCCECTLAGLACLPGPIPRRDLIAEVRYSTGYNATNGTYRGIVTTPTPLVYRNKCATILTGFGVNLSEYWYTDCVHLIIPPDDPVNDWYGHDQTWWRFILACGGRWRLYAFCWQESNGAGRCPQVADLTATPCDVWNPSSSGPAPVLSFTTFNHVDTDVYTTSPMMWLVHVIGQANFMDVTVKG